MIDQGLCDRATRETGVASMPTQSTADVDNFVGNPDEHRAKPREISRCVGLLKTWAAINP
jgi:hypothetical protein